MPASVTHRGMAEWKAESMRVAQAGPYLDGGAGCVALATSGGSAPA